MNQNRTEASSSRGLIDELLLNFESNGIESKLLDETEVTEYLQNEITDPAVIGPAHDADTVPDTVCTTPALEEITKANTGVTFAPLGVASHGSIIVPSTPDMDGPISLWPPSHVAILRDRDIVPDIGAALEYLTERHRVGDDDAVIVSGPSATGDMGGRVTGVHGPKEMTVVIVT